MYLRRTLRRARSGEDDGLVAVIVALSISSFLLVIGAFAVDFGNAFARRQNLQTSADLAALAAAAMLPDQEAARGKVHDLFCSSNNENHVLGWPVGTCASNDWMSLRGPSDGEVIFYGSDINGDGRYQANEEAAPGTTATAVRVLTPPAHVEFGLGAVTGATGVDLQRAATAKMGSATGPGGVQPIPVTPPETGSLCVTDTAGSTTTTTGVTLPVQSVPLISISLSQVVGIRGGQQLTVRALTDLGVQIGGVGVTARVRFASEFGTVSPVPVTWSDAAGGYQFPAFSYGILPAHVYVYLELDVDLGLGQVTVITGWQEINYVGQDPCSGITVLRRGFVEETRRTTGNANALVLNLKLGLDHAVRPWNEYPERNSPAVGQDQCNAQAGTSFTTGDVVNCLKINTGPLVDSTHAAYLDPGGLLLRTGCPGIGGTAEVGGHFGVDNNTLFQPAFIPGDQAFRDGVEAAIRTGQPPVGNQLGALSAKVFLCPRLFVVPVLDAPIVNGGLSGGSYPVQGLVYLYIDDTEPPDHGVTFATGDTVTQLHAIVIDPAWFPRTADLPLPVGEYLGENLTKQVALVHDIDDPGT